MKVSELIKELNLVLEKDGDLDVIITGAYGSCDDSLNIEVDKHFIYSCPNENDLKCIIVTSLCSG